LAVSHSVIQPPRHAMRLDTASGRRWRYVREVCAHSDGVLQR
jgi:hypothetical protein